MEKAREKENCDRSGEDCHKRFFKCYKNCLVFSSKSTCSSGVWYLIFES